MIEKCYFLDEWNCSYFPTNKLPSFHRLIIRKCFKLKLWKMILLYLYSCNSVQIVNSFICLFHSGFHEKIQKRVTSNSWTSLSSSNLTNYIAAMNSSDFFKDQNHIFNLDETNIQLCVSTGKVRSIRETRNVFEIAPIISQPLHL